MSMSPSLPHLAAPRCGRLPLRFPVLGLTAILLLSACAKGELDWDMRYGKGALDTTGAALNATGPKPQPDARGVISYPGYQVAVARRGDTVGSLAARIGLSAEELARYNSLTPGDSLREGEVVALPGRVAASPASGGTTTGGIIGSGAAPGTGIDVSTIATTALDRVDSTRPAPAAAKAPTGAEPVRHQVKRGETAFSIARSYNVSAKALADWNGLGSDLAVREGQFLIIPTSTGAAPAAVRETAPGEGSPTPTPPSAKKPLPDEKVAPAAEKPKATPASPEMSQDRTSATATRFAMPVQGKIIRGYVKKKNDGVDISAAAGTPVKSAAEGTVAAVTKDTEGTQIIVIRHADGILTVYGGVDGLKVKKGDKVSRGQTIAAIRAAATPFLHFEVRKGVDSVDPMPYLQ